MTSGVSRTPMTARVQPGPVSLNVLIGCPQRGQSTGWTTTGWEYVGIGGETTGEEGGGGTGSKATIAELLLNRFLLPKNSF